MLANRFDWEWDINDQKGPWDHTNFPAREIYERVLPTAVERFGDVPYWRSSLYGGSTANDYTVGDAHIWDGMLWEGLLQCSMANLQQYGTAKCPLTKTTKLTPRASSANSDSSPAQPPHPAQSHQ